LVAVTKYAQPEWIRAIVDLGETELGENRPQQLAGRAESLRLDVHWHLIGHLQRNKVRQVVPYVTLIHSVDSFRLLAALDAEAASLNRRLRVLVEVNLSGEAQKHGFAAADLEGAWSEVTGHRHLSVEGFMTMAAEVDDPEQARPTFRALRELRDRLQSRCPAEMELKHLSMGMSGDFEPAVEEGATLVRIGSALWQGLETPG
ncbi:MAG: YggS family pyridoxal phosphate-dependent enzyme, partial [Planctomycetaceae bacterium]